MEYKGYHIEDKVYNSREHIFENLDYNHQDFTKEDLLGWIRGMEEKEIELQNSNIDHTEVKIAIDADSAYDSDNFQADAYMEISLRWGEAETETEKEKRIKSEKMRIDKLIERKREQEEAQKLVNKTKVEQAMKILQENGYSVIDAAKEYTKFKNKKK